MIPTLLIQDALSLIGKTMIEIELPWYFDNGTPLCGGYTFSIEKFYYYLLSPEFIEKYELNKGIWGTYQWNFGEAIYEYQSGNS